MTQTPGMTRMTGMTGDDTTTGMTRMTGMTGDDTDDRNEQNDRNDWG